LPVAVAVLLDLLVGDSRDDRDCRSHRCWDAAAAAAVAGSIDAEDDADSIDVQEEHHILEAYWEEVHSAAHSDPVARPMQPAHRERTGQSPDPTLRCS